MLKWSHIRTRQGKSTLFTVDSAGETYTVADNHPNFNVILSLLQNEGADEKTIKKLMDPATYFLKDRLVYRDDDFYLDNNPTPISTKQLNTLFALDSMLEDTGGTDAK